MKRFRIWAETKCQRCKEPLDDFWERYNGKPCCVNCYPILVGVEKDVDVLKSRTIKTAEKRKQRRR